MIEVKFTHDIRVIILSHVSYLLINLPGSNTLPRRQGTQGSKHSNANGHSAVHTGGKTEGSWLSEPHLVGKYALLQGKKLSLPYQLGKR